MDKLQFDKGYSITSRLLDNVRDDDDIVMSMLDLLNTLDNTLSDLSLFLGARAAFAEPRFHKKNIYMLLSAPITTISKLRTLGFTDTISSLMMDPTLYNIIDCGRLTFTSMFKYDDQGMAKRALIGYLMDIPFDAFPNSEKFYDLKVKVWNECLDLAKKLKEKYSTFVNVSYSELTQVIIDCSYGDAIGNDETGEEEFYNKFIGMSLVDIRYIGGNQLHDYLVTKITEIGDKLLEDFEWGWSRSPQRLMLYLRLKTQLFRLNPNLEDKWYYLDTKDVCVGKERW